MVTFAHDWGKNICAPEMKLWAVTKRVKVSNIEHCHGEQHCIITNVKTKELTLKQILSVPCTTCGAATGEACELHTGALRIEPHRDRKLSAADAVEARTRKT